MTDLQVKYQALLEEKRSNKAKEAETHRSNVAKESVLPYEINKLIADTDLSESNKAKVEAETQRLYADIERIKADTTLTRGQAAYLSLDKAFSWLESTSKTVKNFTDVGMNIIELLFGSFSKL